MASKAARKAGRDLRRRRKMRKVMHEFKEGRLHSGSKSGPTVKSRKQAIAIAMSESRRGD